jgi:hypothetical protein
VFTVVLVHQTAGMCVFFSSGTLFLWESRRARVERCEQPRSLLVDLPVPLPADFICASCDTSHASTAKFSVTVRTTTARDRDQFRPLHYSRIRL